MIGSLGGGGGGDTAAAVERWRLVASNEAAIKAPEAVKNKLAEAMGDNSVGNDRAQKQDMENKGEQYVTAIAEQSRQMHQECDATMKAKSPAFTQAAGAKEVAKANMEKASEISKEITAVNEAIGQVKEATVLVQKEQENVFAEKDVQKHLYKATLEEKKKGTCVSRFCFLKEATVLDKLSKKKVMATGARVEVVKASEHEAKMRLETTRKLIEGIMTEDKPVGESFGGSVKKALEMVRDMILGPREICVQSDSKNVVSLLQKKNGSSKAAACILEIARESFARDAYNLFASPLECYFSGEASRILNNQWDEVREALEVIDIEAIFEAAGSMGTLWCGGFAWVLGVNGSALLRWVHHLQEGEAVHRSLLRRSSKYTEVEGDKYFVEEEWRTSLGFMLRYI
ncbi:hypothetical protein RHMOL_Rhmol10G0213900 [Rhododendron molle]|uniref:Uncharacterized protein n=1 Tax=Rhododendron molle TaxID=49168 RepID=A0ACC0M5S9_RHOML|nr:hypothetical protein RHMOL_Rhmol10G0213900 [Rhododendron molle]